jgi:hypothetical protein
MPGSYAADPAPAPKWLIPLVLGVAILAFWPTLNGGFLADDFAYIVRFRELPWSEWPGLFMRDWSGGIWGERLRELRPFVALSFMGDARLFGGHPLGYRLTNLGLHLLSTLLLTRLAWYYATLRRDEAANAANRIAPRIAATVTGLVFGLHPAHAEAVAWITGRVDMQATAGALLFWTLAEGYSARGNLLRAVMGWVAFFLGLYSKELCLFAPLLLLLRWGLLDPRAGRAVWIRRLIIFAGVGAILLVYAYCRRAAFGSDSIGYNLWTDEPAWQRQAHYAGWLIPLLPFPGQGEWRNLPPLVTLHTAWLILASGIVVGLVIALSLKARTAAWVLFFGGVWYLATVAPMTGVVYFSPRHLYFPSVGIALAAGVACAAWRSGYVAGAVLVLWCAVGHCFAIQPWRHAANVSRAALAAVEAELRSDPPPLLVTSVPETLGPTLLWAWSSPQCVSTPFLSRPPVKVMERPANYTRSAQWTDDRRPTQTVREAAAAVALFVDAAGQVSCRSLRGAAWQEHQATYAALLERGGLNPDTWSEWVKAAAGTDPATALTK